MKDSWCLEIVSGNPCFQGWWPPCSHQLQAISLQPICGKLLEQIIHSQILCHLKSNGILTDHQLRGFLPKSSTLDALATALHDWYGCLEHRKSVTMALFDLSKAFDCVPHSPHLIVCCWSWELLVCLALCILCLDHTSPTDPSWWLFMESTPLLFPFSPVFPRALSWAPSFSHLCEWPFPV